MEKRNSPLIDFCFGILIPSLILINLSDEANLGAQNAFVIALLFPFSLGFYEIIKYRTANIFAIIGLISISLTGGIGLLKLDNHWFAVKEAAIPATFGSALLIYTLMGHSLFKRMLFKSELFNTEKILEALHRNGCHEQFMLAMKNANYYMSGTLFFSAVMNYLLAKWVVTSPTGSEAFNEELGHLTLLSYPVIALPSLLMMFIILYWLTRSLNKYTGLKLEEVFVQGK